MRIYSMTATFGKLENQTLRLEPGLNIIARPNEWGKSTWCAFLVTMLYGLDTKERGELAVKKRYDPWSGKPMAGRIDLNWDGRDITIERKSNKRTPLGEFRAYETATGMDVPELTAANCGEKLLGVEKSVFMRAGFLRLADLPVTADEALRRRLNSLVTTGDESGTADKLGEQLKKLKNSCYSNRSNGLIPEVEAERKLAEGKLNELHNLRLQSQQIQQRQRALDAHIQALENHRVTLAYQAAQEDLRRVADAEEAARFAAIQLQSLEESCQSLPSREQAQQKLHTLQDLQQKQQNARMDVQMLPAAPQEPKAPLCFYGLTGQQALEQAQKDAEEYRILSAPAKKSFPLWIFGIIAAVIGIVALVLKLWIPGGLLLAAGAGMLFAQSMLSHKQNQAHLAVLAKQQAIVSRYGGGEPENWLVEAMQYDRLQQEYDTAVAAHNLRRQQALEAVAQLDKALENATDGMGVSAARDHFSAAIRQHDSLIDARQKQQQAQKHAETLRSVAKPAQKPAQPDHLTCSAEETARQLSDAAYEQKQLQLRLGQYEGRMDPLGSEDVLQRELDAINARLKKLELTKNALEFAQKTLQEATNELQRRFAPRISQQSRDLFTRLTGGRYERLTLMQDFQVDTGTTEEVNDHAAQLRSDGTMDQLYLALRLAVAKELTPHAPLVLDDALVRFDDTRHAAAMHILKEEAQQKQIILFTCHSREENP